MVNLSVPSGSSLFHRQKVFTSLLDKMKAKKALKASILPCDKNVNTLNFSLRHKIEMPWLFKANAAFNLLNIKISGKFFFPT